MPRTHVARTVTATLAGLTTTLCMVAMPHACWAQAQAPSAPQSDAWSRQIEEENERQRKAAEQQIEQYKREALERERMEIYKQGQENFRQQQNNLRYQRIQGTP